MPNICNYSMRVKGKKENIEEFIKVMKADYNYNTMEFTADRHMYRIFEAYLETDIEEVDDDVYAVTINGDCAWSVNSCMFDNGFSYYGRNKNDYGDKFRGTTVPIESKRLELDIEIFSEETGCCFMEHYIVRKGDVEVDECVDYYEYYVEDYETKEEAEEDLDIKITDEEWDNREDNDYYINRGGIEWDFEI